MNEQQVRQIVDDVVEILLKKNADYGSAGMDFGTYGNMVMLWNKIKRYRTLVENEDDPNYESIDDTLRDIIGYAIIGLIVSESEKK